MLASLVKGIFGGEICFCLLGGENFIFGGEILYLLGGDHCWWRDFLLVGRRPLLVERILLVGRRDL